MSQWPWFWPWPYPTLQLYCYEVHNNALDYCCDFWPTNVQTKACSLKLFKLFFISLKFGADNKLVLAGLKGAKTLGKWFVKIQAIYLALLEEHIKYSSPWGGESFLLSLSQPNLSGKLCLCNLCSKLCSWDIQIVIWLK